MYNSNGNTSEHCHKVYAEFDCPICLKLPAADYIHAIKLWESMALIAFQKETTISKCKHEELLLGQAITFQHFKFSSCKRMDRTVFMPLCTFSGV